MNSTRFCSNMRDILHQSCGFKGFVQGEGGCISAWFSPPALKQCSMLRDRTQIYTLHDLEGAKVWCCAIVPGASIFLKPTPLV